MIQTSTTKMIIGGGGGGGRILGGGGGGCRGGGGGGGREGQKPLSPYDCAPLVPTAESWGARPVRRLSRGGIGVLSEPPVSRFARACTRPDAARPGRRRARSEFSAFSAL